MPTRENVVIEASAADSSQGKLEHQHQGASIGGIQFSPDGKPLIAGEYPGGVIHVWDMASGERLATMHAGEEYRSTTDYFMPSPDWKTVFAWQEGKGAFEKQERDGKTFQSVQYNGIIRSWNLDDGSLSRTYQHSPPHGIRAMYLAPGGKYFLTLDEVPGEFDGIRPRALTLWDSATGQGDTRHLSLLEVREGHGEWRPGVMTSFS